jgi:hypothetical protein
MVYCCRLIVRQLGGGGGRERTVLIEILQKRFWSTRADRPSWPAARPAGVVAMLAEMHACALKTDRARNTKTAHNNGNNRDTIIISRGHDNAMGVEKYLQWR